MTATVETLDINEMLATARAGSAGRATKVFKADKGILSQVVLALTKGNGLSKHANPGEALLMVLHGRVRLATDNEEWELSQWNQIPIPQALHELVALEDSVVTLTIAKLPQPEQLGMPEIR